MTALQIRQALVEAKDELYKALDEDLTRSDRLIHCNSALDGITRIVEEALEIIGSVKYEERRTLHEGRLRTLCTEKNWYSRGTSENYAALMDYVTSLKNVMTDDIVAIATDIKQHSDTRFSVSEICFTVADVCWSHFYEIEEGE